MSANAIDGLPVLVDVLLPGQVAFRTTSEAQRAGGGGTVRDEDWDILERDVREAVLKGLQARLDLVLEQRVKEVVSAIVETGIAGMSGEIKANLNATIKEAVNRAVTQEVSRVRATKVR